MATELLALHWMTLHGLIVLLGLVIYVAASHTLHRRRHPSAAIAWVDLSFDPFSSSKRAPRSRISLSRRTTASALPAFDLGQWKAIRRE